MVGDERTGISASGFRLQYGGFDLEKIPFIQPAADAAHRACPPAECLPRLGGHHQIQVALAVALFHIRQAMPLVREGLQALAEHAPVAHLDGQFTAIGTAQGAGDAQPVAGIHQAGDLLEPSLLLGLKAGLLQKQLKRAGLIRQCEKRELAHHPPRHHPSGHGHGLVAFLAVGQIGMGLLQCRHPIAWLKRKRIGTLPQFFQRP